MFNDIETCLNYIESQKRSHGKTDLNHMFALCELFNNPQNDFKVIHVAGTNGKGSVVLYMTSILMEAGYKVGSFTSPYIDCFNERIECNKEYIPDDKIIEYANLITSKYPLMDEKGIERPSFFAFITLMCFMYFSEIKVDVAVVECGIGGLLDDTNVVKPVLSIISNVAFDHMNVLGNTIEEIATNKLGIVKDHTPLVSIQNDAIKNLIKEKCYEKYAPYTLVKKSNIQNVFLGLGKTKFDYLEYKDINLQMSGLYQCENAAIVIEGVRFLNANGFNISKDNVMNGLANTFWLGRLEVVCKNPLIILDGAHNPDAMARLSEYIQSIKRDHKIRLILAISSNKDSANMIPLIEPYVDELIFTSFSYKRSDEGINIYNLSNHPNKILEEDIYKIFKRIKNEKMINIFSGSLYFVSEIRKMIKKK